jgi:hypothetical protein
MTCDESLGPWNSSRHGKGAGGEAVSMGEIVFDWSTVDCNIFSRIDKIDSDMTNKVFAAAHAKDCCSDGKGLWYVATIECEY